MAWRIDFDPRAEKELSRLDRQAAQRIVRFLVERLADIDDPHSLGAAPQGSPLAGFWKYRIGDYRLVVSVEDQSRRIVVLRVGHRREVYR